MWKPFLYLCYFMTAFVPNRGLRERLRTHRLYDFRRKYDALRAAFPELNFRNTKIVKGGWNIGFIVDGKYVFKVRKDINRNPSPENITRESRLTHALAPFSPVRIPLVDIVDAGGYTFFRYEFIPGKNLNKFPLRTIRKNANAWGRTIAKFIYGIHNARPMGLDDLVTANGDGWNHNDICNNIIVNPKTMRIVGIIDWEYAKWGQLSHEFHVTTAYSQKMKKSGIGDVVRREYAKLEKNS